MKHLRNLCIIISIATFFASCIKEIPIPGPTQIVYRDTGRIDTLIIYRDRVIIQLDTIYRGTDTIYVPKYAILEYYASAFPVSDAKTKKWYMGAQIAFFGPSQHLVTDVKIRRLGYGFITSDGKNDVMAIEYNDNDVTLHKVIPLESYAMYEANSLWSFRAPYVSIESERVMLYNTAFYFDYKFNGQAKSSVLILTYIRGGVAGFWNINTKYLMKAVWDSPHRIHKLYNN